MGFSCQQKIISSVSVQASTDALSLLFVSRSYKHAEAGTHSSYKPSTPHYYCYTFSIIYLYFIFYFIIYICNIPTTPTIPHNTPLVSSNQPSSPVQREREREREQRCATMTGSRSPWPTIPLSSTSSSASTRLLHHRRHLPVLTSSGPCVSAAPSTFRGTPSPATKRSPPGPAPPPLSPGAAPPQQAAAPSMVTRSPAAHPNTPIPQDLRFHALSLLLFLSHSSFFSLLRLSFQTGSVFFFLFPFWMLVRVCVTRSFNVVCMLKGEHCREGNQLSLCF